MRGEMDLALVTSLVGEEKETGVESSFEEVISDSIYGGHYGLVSLVTVCLN